MRLFLDTSVLLAASGSARGASREVFRVAPGNGWSLIATPYVIEEVLTNIGRSVPPRRPNGPSCVGTSSCSTTY